MNNRDDEIDGDLADALREMADRAPEPPSARDLETRLRSRAARRTSAIVAMAAAAAAVAAAFAVPLLGVFDSGGEPVVPEAIGTEKNGGYPAVAGEFPVPAIAPPPEGNLPRPIEVGSGRLAVESLLEVRLRDLGVESGIIEKDAGGDVSLAIASSVDVDMERLRCEFEALFRNYESFSVKITDDNLAFSMAAR